MSSEPKSTGDRLRAAATGQQLAKKEPSSFPQMLTAYKSQIALALPKHITGDRMLRVALTAFRQNPKLAECDPKSVFAAIIIGAQLGLEPGVLGQAYLVPYKKECQFIPGWQGLCDLVNRSGRASVWTGAVFDGDYFEYEYGSNPRIVHRSAGNDDQPDKLTHCYAVGRVKGAEFPVIEVWSVPKIIRHRDLYNKVGDKHYSYKNFEMYGRKVPLLQVLKYMPKSIELATALDLDHASNVGQVVSVQEAIEGTFMPAPASEVDQSTGEIVERKTGAAAIEWIKGASALDDLTSRYSTLHAQHTEAGESIPIELEAARNERRDAIQARDAKAKA
jgi:recombination protein RecT